MEKVRLCSLNHASSAQYGSCIKKFCDIIIRILVINYKITNLKINFYTNKANNFDVEHIPCCLLQFQVSIFIESSQ